MTKYLIVCTEYRYVDGSLLFWRPDSAGYTANLDEAGKFNAERAKEMNEKGRDIALTEEELLDLPEFKKKTIVAGPLDFLQLLKQKKKAK